MFNHKGNAEEHIIQQKKKTEAAYQTILTIMGNQHFNNIELETAWKLTLLETCIQPIITYEGETWEMTKQEEKESTKYKKTSSKNSHGTTINTHGVTLCINRAARHYNNSD